MDNLANTVALPVWVVALFLIGVIGSIGHLYIKSYELDKKQAVSDTESDNIMKELQGVKKTIDDNQKENKALFDKLDQKLDFFLGQEFHFLRKNFNQQ